MELIKPFVAKLNDLDQHVKYFTNNRSECENEGAIINL